MGFEAEHVYLGACLPVARSRNGSDHLVYEEKERVSPRTFLSADQSCPYGELAEPDFSSFHFQCAGTGD